MLKCRDLTYNVSLQFGGCAGVFISCLNSRGKQYFPIGILGQVWCLIVLIPDLCPLSYFVWRTYLPVFYKFECKVPYLIFPNVYIHAESHISHAQILFYLKQRSIVVFCRLRIQGYIQLHYFMQLCKRLLSESMCVCSIFLKPLGQLKPNFMWHHHALGEMMESLFIDK